MTTIAWDGRFIAADSGVTRGAVVLRTPHRKLHHWIDGNNVTWTVAASGPLNVLASIRTWVEGGCDPLAWPWGCDNAQAFVTKDRKAFSLEDGTRRLVPLEGPDALGSGHEVALGVMSLHHDAREAVRAAIRTIEGNRGPIRWYDTKEDIIGTWRQ